MNQPKAVLQRPFLLEMTRKKAFLSILSFYYFSPYIRTTIQLLNRLLQNGKN